MIDGSANITPMGRGGIDMDLNIPKTEQEQDETEWLSAKDLKVGDSLSLNVERVHLGEKAVVFFTNDNKGLTLFHTSEYDGQTLGERALIALGQALNIEGETTAEEVIEQANDKKKLSIKISHEAFEKDGEARSYKRITFKC